MDANYSLETGEALAYRAQRSPSMTMIHLRRYPRATAAPSKRRGVTLVEVVIAMAVAAFVMLSFMTAIVFMLRQNAENRQHYEALQILEFHQGLIAAANPARLGATNLEEIDFEDQFNHRRAAPLAVRAHPDEDHPGDEYFISFEFTGWGAVSDAEENTLEADLPDNHLDWPTNRWAGSYVTITQGRGAGQVMLIRSNTANTLTVTGDLTGATDVPWDREPDSTSRFAINNARTVDIEITWGDGTRHRRIQRTLALPLN